VVEGSTPQWALRFTQVNHLRYDPMVRIEGFHPFGPGSIPGIGICSFSSVGRAVVLSTTGREFEPHKEHLAWMAEWLRRQI
jgi:hypothetical protein